MIKNYLFSPVYRKIGYVLLAIALVIYIGWYIPSFSYFYDEWTFPMISITPTMEENWDNFNIYPRIAHAGWFEMMMAFMSVGCVFVAFSKERDEDECISQIRMQSLVWASMVNTVLVLLSTLFIYGGAYLTCMAIYPFSTFLFFMIKYNIALYKFRKSNEE